ncbi:MAG: alpha/beta fold hydrolase [Chitinivibrionales bacterium]|nr:alpha/beta fold hydrolase [Chitinivibrionales bacterium]
MRCFFLFYRFNLLQSSRFAALFVVWAAAWLVHADRSSWPIDHWAPVAINGTRLWLSVFGSSPDAPIVLFVHGGPGATETAFVRRFHAPLGERCLVATYDQRGAGKSYSRAVFRDSLTIGLYVQDLVAVARHLVETYSQEKVVVVGHSWGSIIAPLAVRQHPELFSAYIGTGQVVNVAQGEQLSYAFALRQARKTGNTHAVRQLTRLGPPCDGVYGSERQDIAGAIGALSRQRQWLRRLGGMYYRGAFRDKLVAAFHRSEQYSFIDRLRYARGARLSARALWPEIAQVDLARQVPCLAVPVWFCLGRYDHNTPSGLAAEYLSDLKAPWKERVWFERSGHSPALEETGKFHRLILERVLPRTRGVGTGSMPGEGIPAEHVLDELR